MLAKNCLVHGSARECRYRLTARCRPPARVCEPGLATSWGSGRAPERDNETNKQANIPVYCLQLASFSVHLFAGAARFTRVKIDGSALTLVKKGSDRKILERYSDNRSG